MCGFVLFSLYRSKAGRGRHSDFPKLYSQSESESKVMLSFDSTKKLQD